MATATVVVTMETLITGAGLKYPVIMKCPFDYTPYIFRYQVAAGETTLAIGSVCEMATQTKTLAKSTAAGTFVNYIVLDTEYNKSVLEAAGTTITKIATFAASVYLDVLLLVPGMILSMKISAGADIEIGESLIADAVDGALSVGTTAGAVIGRSLNAFDWTDTTILRYAPVLITR